MDSLEALSEINTGDVVFVRRRGRDDWTHVGVVIRSEDFGSEDEVLPSVFFMSDGKLVDIEHSFDQLSDQDVELIPIQLPIVEN